MSILLMWVAFFGVIQMIGWLFYWRSELPMFSGEQKHARRTLAMDLPPSK